MEVVNGMDFDEISARTQKSTTHPTESSETTEPISRRMMDNTCLYNHHHVVVT